MVVPCELEQGLTRDFKKAGIKPGELAPSVAATSSIALLQEFHSPDSNSPLVVEALLLDLVSRELNVITERSSYRPPWVRTVLDYLDDTFDQPWTLKDIADQIGVHPVYLCRAFSEHLNCTFGEYIRTLRILRGWQLLSLTAESLADIANQSGFADQSHFTRLFKKKFGVAPGQYRRSGPLRSYGAT
jgi:AraC-like DNA-binding protein